MVNVQVGPRSLRQAATAARKAADDVAEVDLSIVAELAEAVPGGQAQGYASMCADHLDRECQTWVEDMRGYADKLVSSARRYDRDEQAAEDDFDGLRQGGRR